MTYGRKSPQNEIEFFEQKIKRLEARIARMEAGKVLTGPIYDSDASTLPVDAVEGQIAIDKNGIFAVPVGNQQRMSASQNITIAAGNLAPLDWSSFTSGDDIFDVSTNTFHKTGVYAIHLTVTPNATAAGKSFAITIDVNNTVGEVLFASSEFPFDPTFVSKPWGCLTVVWPASAGDNFDTAIYNGDSSSHIFGAFGYVARIL